MTRRRARAAEVALLALAAAAAGCAPEPRWCKANVAVAAVRAYQPVAPFVPPADDLTPEEREAVRARARELDDEALGLKIAEYVLGCTNASAASAYEARRQYLAWAPTGELTGREVPRALPAVKGSERCATAAHLAASMRPPEPTLEAAGRDYAEALATLARVAGDASAYYAGKAYRRDRMAHGKELHPALLGALDAFVRADLALRAAVRGLTRPLSQRALARVEAAEGKRFRYHRRRVLELARELVELGDPADPSDPSGGARALVPRDYDGALTTLSSGLDALRAYGAEHRGDLVAGEDTSAASAYDRFVEACAAFVATGRAYGVCLGRAATVDGKVDLSALPRCAGGGRRELTERYDAFVHTSNASPFPR